LTKLKRDVSVSECQYCYYLDQAETRRFCLRVPVLLLTWPSWDETFLSPSASAATTLTKRRRDISVSECQYWYYLDQAETRRFCLWVQVLLLPWPSWDKTILSPSATNLVQQSHPCASSQHMLESLWRWPYGPNRQSWPTGLIKPCPSLIRYDTIQTLPKLRRDTSLRCRPERRMPYKSGCSLACWHTHSTHYLMQKVAQYTKRVHCKGSP